MKILIAGTCHAEVVRHAIVVAGKISGKVVDCRVIGLQPLDSQSEDLLDFISSCDVFVWQINDRRFNPVAGIISKETPQITFPVIGMNWLWPFATQPHPQNRREPPYLPNGPFPESHSDALLNRVLKQHAQPDAALAEFSRLDPTLHTDLDRLFELTKSKTLSIEQEADIRIWPMIEAEFRDKRLFDDWGHPSWELFEPLCWEILRRLPFNLDRSKRDAIASRLGHARMQWQAPIHPRVAEHFGLNWYRCDMKFWQGPAGWLTYDENCRRYAHFDIDFDVFRAAHMTATNDQFAVAEELLRAAIRAAPNNCELEHMLARNLWKQQRPIDALVHIRRAVQDPHVSTDDRVHQLYCAILAGAGQEEASAAAAREAIRSSRYPAPHYHFLSRALSRLGRTQEAIAAARAAIAHDRYATAYHLVLGRGLKRSGRPDEAASAFADAVQCEPRSPSVLAAAAQELFALDLIAQAQAYAARWLDLQPNDLAAQDLCARLSQAARRAA